MIDSGRLARAIWLKVQPVSGGYLVTGGAAGHVVEVDGARVTCHCPDAERMGDSCKHSLAIRLRAGDGEVIDRLRALGPPPTGRSTERRTPQPHPESPNSGGTGPDSRQAGSRVAPGATNAYHQGAQPRG